MFCQGKPQYEAVREMMDDPEYYKYALGISYAIPSAEALRQRFDMIGDSLRKDILQANIDLLREMKIEPSALENGYMPVDIDVIPCDNSKTKKEGVSRTYKGFDGFAPIMAYMGTEGYLVNTQLRIGKQLFRFMAFPLSEQKYAPRTLPRIKADCFVQHTLMVKGKVPPITQNMYRNSTFPISS